MIRVAQGEGFRHEPHSTIKNKGEEMKPRRVIVTIEMTTDMPVKALRMKEIYKAPGWQISIDQIQVNVVKDEKKKK